MSYKALINTVSSASAQVTAGGIIPVGNAVHGTGNAIKINGNGITLNAAGYYIVSADITATPAAQGSITVTMLCDGLPVSGAVAVSPPVGAGDPVTLPVQALIYIPCACTGRKNITFVSDVAATITNINIIVEKAE